MAIKKVHSTDNGFDARICLFSQRKIGNLVSRCGHFEFEDVICQVDHVDMITPEISRFLMSNGNSVDTTGTYSNVWYRLINSLGRHISIRSVNPGIETFKIQKYYDLFLAFFQFPRDIISINAVKGWKDRCRTSVCWIDDLWISNLGKWEKHLKKLADFDYVIINYHYSVERVASLIGRSCAYMAPGVDMLRFCPYPNAPKRAIDVYCMGRNSPGIHRALIKVSDSDNILYLYDTIKRMEFKNEKEHRDMIANLIKRSRYFVVNIAKGGNDAETQGQMEIGFRYFEGAGGGAIMIGEAPATENFRQMFDWPDAVISLKKYGNNPGELIRELDADPNRQEVIRRNNVTQSLLRHDWSYRWKDILKMINLEPMPELLLRENKLRELASFPGKDRMKST